jgi:hypothetical protein
VALSIRKKLTLTSLTSGSRSVGRVRLRTEVTEFFIRIEGHKDARYKKIRRTSSGVVLIVGTRGCHVLTHVLQLVRHVLSLFVTSGDPSAPNETRHVFSREGVVCGSSFEGLCLVFHSAKKLEICT